MKISVLLPVFNAERFLKESLESILNQTYRDFELIIIDDASTDRSLQVTNFFKDKRIKIIKNTIHKGITYSLNKALKQAKGEFIARMDADDTAYPERFKKQLDVLKKYSEVGVVGSWIELIDEKGLVLGIKKFPETFERVKRESIFRNPLCHPTVLFRKKLIVLYGGYDERLNGAEDYDLWLRLMQHTHIISLPKPLLHYRLLKSSISFGAMKQVEYAFVKAKLKAVIQYGYPWWHSVVIFKSFVSLLVPSTLKRIFYEKYFQY